MAHFRRLSHRHRIFDIQRRSDDHHHWHSLRTTNFENRYTGTLAIWQTSHSIRNLKQLPVSTDEHYLDIHRRHLDMPDTSAFWGFTLYYHYRNTIWHTTFQTGRPRPITFRQKNRALNL